MYIIMRCEKLEKLGKVAGIWYFQILRLFRCNLVVLERCRLQRD